VLALHGYYSDLLGQARETHWAFDLGRIYSTARRIDGPCLVAQFSAAELKAAALGLDRTSVPGPDVLGPSFFHASWHAIGPDMLRLAEGFHADVVNLDRINRAHVVLLWKRNGVLPPSALRPISVQNCDMKILCKALTTRLQ
jgi:hypothetical protein